MKRQAHGFQLGSPVFENIEQDPKYSFYWHCHDFPSPLAKWNYHPEYELHLIQHSRGRYFVGDYIGRFAAGNLVLVGPNMPHAWFSDLDSMDERLDDRDVVLQFRGEWLDRIIALCPELHCLLPMLEASTRGIEFIGPEAAECALLMARMGDQDTPERLLTMLTILRRLATDEYRELASQEYCLDMHSVTSEQVDAVLRHISDHFNDDLRMSALAERHGMTPSSFSRFFKRATGDTFVAFLRRIRIEHACRLLLEGQQSIAEICFQVGYNNLSNFNRHFREVKRMTPRQYQQSLRMPSRPRNGVSGRSDLAVQCG